MSAMFQRVALIGLGLIGSSLAHAMRRKTLAGEITGFARSGATRDKARELGLADTIFPSAKEAVEGADLVILCSPVGTYAALAEEIAPALKPGAILTDVGSVKGAVVRDVGSHVPAGVHFIPGRPIAGTEQSGPESGFAELFINRWCILTPVPGSDPAAVERLAEFWRACGSNVETMTPEHHDLVLAITSHLPHLIAYNIVAQVLRHGAAFRAELQRFEAALEAGDAAAIEALIAGPSAGRGAWKPASEATAPLSSGDAGSPPGGTAPPQP